MNLPRDSVGVLLDRDSLDRGDLDLGRLRNTLTDWRLYDTRDPMPVAERMAGAGVVVSNKVVLNAALLEAAPDLRLVCVAATGTNNVDLAAAARLGIPVCNARGYATPAVVQHVFALILSLSTRLVEPALLSAVSAPTFVASTRREPPCPSKPSNSSCATASAASR